LFRDRNGRRDGLTRSRSQGEWHVPEDDKVLEVSESSNNEPTSFNWSLIDEQLRDETSRDHAIKRFNKRAGLPTVHAHRPAADKEYRCCCDSQHTQLDPRGFRAVARIIMDVNGPLGNLSGGVPRVFTGQKRAKRCARSRGRSRCRSRISDVCLSDREWEDQSRYEEALMSVSTATFKKPGSAKGQGAVRVSAFTGTCR